MKSPVVTITVLAAALLLSHGRTLAQEGRAPEDNAPPWLGEISRLTGSLELSEAQADQISEIVSEHWDDGLAQATIELRSARRSAGAVLHDPASTDSQIVAATQEVAGKAQNLALERHWLLVDVWGLLTPAQQRTLRVLERQRDDWNHRTFGGTDEHPMS